MSLKRKDDSLIPGESAKRVILYTSAQQQQHYEQVLRQRQIVPSDCYSACYPQEDASHFLILANSLGWMWKGLQLGGRSENSWTSTNYMHIAIDVEAKMTPEHHFDAALTSLYVCDTLHRNVASTTRMAGTDKTRQTVHLKVHISEAFQRVTKPESPHFSELPGIDLHIHKMLRLQRLMEYCYTERVVLDFIIVPEAIHSAMQEKWREESESLSEDALKMREFFPVKKPTQTYLQQWERRMKVLHADAIVRATSNQFTESMRIRFVAPSYVANQKRQFIQMQLKEGAISIEIYCNDHLFTTFKSPYMADISDFDKLRPALLVDYLLQTIRLIEDAQVVKTPLKFWIEDDRKEGRAFMKDYSVAIRQSSEDMIAKCVQMTLPEQRLRALEMWKLKQHALNRSICFRLKEMPKKKKKKKEGLGTCGLQKTECVSQNPE